MPYVVCEGSDSLQMQFPPLAAAPVENFEDLLKLLLDGWKSWHAIKKNFNIIIIPDS